MVEPPPAAAAGVAVVVFAALCVSLANVAAPIVYEAGGNAQTILVLRYTGFLLIAGLWLGARGRLARLDRRRLVACLGVGTAYTIGAGSLLLSFLYLPVSLAILVFFTFPVVTALLDGALARRPPGWGQVACLAAALGGLALALEVERFSLDPAGLGFAALAALAIAVSYVGTQRALPGVENTVVTFHMAIVGLGLAGVLTLATGSFAAPVSTAGWIALAVAVFTFAGAFLAMFKGVSLIGAAPTAMLMNLEPVFTIALSVAVLSEALTGRRLAGGAVVILAVVVSQRLSRPVGPEPIA